MSNLRKEDKKNRKRRQIRELQVLYKHYIPNYENNMEEIQQNPYNTKNDNMLYEYQEMTAERKNTLTFLTENKTIKPIEILTYLQSLHLKNHMECFQTLV